MFFHSLLGIPLHLRIERRNTVLNQMYKAKYITKAELDSLQALPLELKYTRVDQKRGWLLISESN